MANHRKPREQLPVDGGYIRDARDALGLGVREFAELLHYEPSTIRGIETGNSSYSRAGFVEACEVAAADTDDEKASAVLFQLVADLREVYETASTRIDVQRGTNRRISRPILGDANGIAGRWFAIWQTALEHGEAAILETVEVIPARTRGMFEVANNSDGSWILPTAITDADEPRHFLWKGEGHCFGQWLSGRFVSLPDGPRVSGAFHLTHDDFYGALVGKWLGVSYASEQTVGALVMARNEQVARKKFAAERGSAERKRNGKEDEDVR